MARKLTARSVAAAKADGKQEEKPDGENGLSLVVYPSGRKSWAVRYRNSAGVLRKITLGTVDQLTLGEARDEAVAIAAKVRKGGDPAAKAQPSDVDTMTVRQASELYMAARRSQPRNRSAAEVQRQFDRYILPAVGDRPVRAVEGSELRAVVTLLASTAPTMANRVHATLATFCVWLADRDRSIVPTSPYAGFSKPKGESARDRVLSWSEVAALWRAAGEAGQPFGSIVRVLLLTGQRRGEVTGLSDAEVDRHQATWVVPADRAKNGEANTVPLSDHAMRELDAVKRIGKAGLVFTTNGNTPFAGHSKSKERLDGQLAFNRPWRLHDIRRSVATGMAELGEPIQVVEALLNHKSGTVSGIAAVYNVHTYIEEKRHAVVAWGRFIVDVVNNETARQLYARTKDRRDFRTAIHADDATWGQCAKALQAGDPEWARQLTAEPERAAA